MPLDNLKEVIRAFVNGFIAGSCNSFDYSLEVLKEEQSDVAPDTLETLLNEVIAEEEIFLCEECGWWCWSHEISFNNSSVCTDCAGEDDE